MAERRKAQLRALKLRTLKARGRLQKNRLALLKRRPPRQRGEAGPTKRHSAAASQASLRLAKKKAPKKPRETKAGRVARFKRAERRRR